MQHGGCFGDSAATLHKRGVLIYAVGEQVDFETQSDISSLNIFVFLASPYLVLVWHETRHPLVSLWELMDDDGHRCKNVYEAKYKQSHTDKINTVKQ